MAGLAGSSATRRGCLRRAPVRACAAAVGANARSAIRLLEEMGASHSGGLSAPHPLPAGGTVRIELPPDVHLAKSEVISYVQDPRTQHILGAAAAAL